MFNVFRECYVYAFIPLALCMPLLEGLETLLKAFSAVSSLSSQLLEVAEGSISRMVDSEVLLRSFYEQTSCTVEESSQLVRSSGDAHCTRRFQLIYISCMDDSWILCHLICCRR